MTISKKWQNYIKFLISKTGNRVDELSAVVGFDIREGLAEIETKNAQYVTTMLKQEHLWLNGKASLDKGELPPPLQSVGFEIETSYNTVMEAETIAVLLNWANKRFKNDAHSLKKINLFLVGDSAAVDVPGYKIKRSRR